MNDNEELYHSDEYLGEDCTDGIRHWKYVWKERVNGKWRYYYSEKGKKPEDGIYLKTKGDHNSKYGTYERTSSYGKVHEKHVVEKSNQLFGSKFTSTTYVRGKTSIQTVRKVGKLEQGLDAVKNAIDRGRSVLANLFKKKK